MGKYTKPYRFRRVWGVGLVYEHPGMSFQPFDIHAILRRTGFLFMFFIGLPLLAGLAIVVLQSVFPWWPAR